MVEISMYGSERAPGPSPVLLETGRTPPRQPPPIAPRMVPLSESAKRGTPPRQPPPIASRMVPLSENAKRGTPSRQPPSIAPRVVLVAENASHLQSRLARGVGAGQHGLAYQRQGRAAVGQQQVVELLPRLAAAARCGPVLA
jgi:hypothetical protein